MSEDKRSTANGNPQDDGYDEKFMTQVVSVGYLMQQPPPAVEFAAALDRRKIIGHKCPECGAVYVPPKGYCPLCVVSTQADRDQVEVSAKGTVTSFTVVNPIQYQGQEEKNVYVVASILLDGASTTMGQQRIGEIAPEDVRTGLRVEAEWAKDTGAKRAAATGPIAHWGPSGEPDAPLEVIGKHLL